MQPQSERIYLSPPNVGSAERQALLRAFDSGWIAPVGSELDAFEAELATYVGGQSCVALASGTGALRLALTMLGVGPGDEVVVSTATFAASAFAVMHTGATPVFCDSERSSWCIDAELLDQFLIERSRIGRLPKAVMPVSLYGATPDYERLAAVCANFDVPIVEDAAEALGSRTRRGMVGGLGHPAIFSFNGNKIMTTSSGGAFVGSESEVQKVRYLATQAREPVLHYEHAEVGFNFRMSNLLAAIGRAQLQRIESFIEARTEINRRYREAYPGWEWCEYGFTERPNNWLSVALLPATLSPQRVCASLDKAGVEARPAWKPMHQQPVFAGAELVGSGAVADDLYRRGICLPSGSALSDDGLAHIFDALEEAIVY